MTRFVSVCAAIGLFVSAGAARAETGMLPNGAVITFDRIRINVDGDPTATEPSPAELRDYLNLAHCTCSEAGVGDEQVIDYETRLSFDTNTDRPGDVFVGTQCDQDLIRPQQCRGINTIPNIDLMAQRPDHLSLSLYEVVNGVDTGPCQQREGDAFVWIGVDSNADNTYDYWVNQSVGKTDDVNGVDTQPPPLPTEIEASSAESSVVLEWTPPVSRAMDVFHYQALCAGPDGLPAVDAGIEPEYQTARDLCGLEQDIALTETPITGGDEGSTVTLPTGLQQLDPAYLCKSLDSGTAAGLTIEGLENGVPVTVVLLAIDQYGNVAGTYLTQTITPQPATDFWEDLHDRGSNVEGGFCLIAETYGDDNPLTQTLRGFRDDTLAHTSFGRWLTDVYYGTIGELGAVVHGSIALRIIAGVLLLPLVAIALAWHALTLPGLLAALALLVLWKRRRKWLIAALAVLVPSIASAQGPTPYWEDQTQTTMEEEGLVKWHVGVRIGPYTPNIDGQLDMDPGPFEQMFGPHMWLPMLDVDRILWRGFGQLGVGGTIGYTQTSAHAWADGSDPADPMRPRSSGDTNTFHFLPLMMSGIYRFTWLDEELGVPIVPYARVGLAYDLWWVRSNGDTAKACWDGSHTSGCDADKAIGASLGVVGSVGLSVRAERIDKASAASMRSSGIQHAGFYAEWSVGKVDGFKPDSKLSVGDSTWFAGVDFEF
jgi:hypothetical protein